MAYLKHPVHGNKHADDSEVAALVAEGWVKWPRTLSEKLGILGIEEPKVDERTKDDLSDALEAAGARVDKRWSRGRLLEELAKA